MMPTKTGRPADALRDQRAVVGGIDAVGAVVGLGDHRREGGAGKGEVHLVADLLQAGLDDGEGDGVESMPSSSLPDFDDDVAVRVGGGAVAGLDHGGGVHLLEDGGAVDDGVERQFFARIDRRVVPRAVNQTGRVSLSASSSVAARPAGSIRLRQVDRRPRRR